MEGVMSNPSMARYECMKCGALLNIKAETEPNTHTCSCKNKQWKFLGRDFTENEWNMELSSFKYIYEKICSILSTYVDIKPSHIELIGLWIMSTYAIEEFSSFPFLFFNATKGSGKTRTITLCSHLSREGHGKVFTGINEVALFRSKPYSTLVLDECEKLINKEAQTLREYLQASYKSSATVTRAVKKKVTENGQTKETYVMEEYKPFRPVILANINGMDEVLGDRCLTFQLEKSDNPFITKLIEDFENNAEIKDLLLLLNNKKCSYVYVVSEKNTVKAWNNYIYTKYKTTQNYTPTLTAQNSTITLTPENEQLFKKIDEMEIHGRNLELVFPLIICAQAIDPLLVDKILPIIKEIITSKRTEEIAESKDISLIQFVSEQTGLWNEYISVKELTQRFKDFIGWTTDEDWLNPHWVGRALTRMQLLAKKSRTSKGVEVMLLPIKAKELLKRYKLPEDKKNEM